MDKIIIKGAREHNLKNIDIELPRDSLIVISGLSGSGKSSLAFDTIFAEGQRRYVESLSSYARMFLGRLDKPDIDYIEGLSPAISIEQKSTHRNPRSTVGTVTEIYDYLRLLFARIGKPHCPKCGKEIKEQSVDQIIDTILTYPEKSKIILLAPVVKNKKGEHSRIIDDAKKAGFARLRLDGIFVNIDDGVKLEKNKKHSIEIVIDRIIMSSGIRKRLAESVETCLDISDGQIIVYKKDEQKPSEEFFSIRNSCADCGISIPELQPRMFSFNNPEGACPDCSGLGMTMEFDPDLIIPDKGLSFNEGAVKTHNPEASWHRSWFEALSRYYNFSLDTPFKDLPKDIYQKIMYGTNDKIKVKYINKKNTGKFEYSKEYEGILAELKRRYLESTSNYIKEWLENFMCQNECSTCGGKRLRPESLSVRVGGKNIFEVTILSVKDAFEFFSNLEMNTTEQHISSQIMKEILARLSFMMNVGLEYLNLERKAATLSGGEAQRIRLATQIGSSLVGVLYILDEPSIGLHQRDNQRLIDTLLHLRNIGNTLIVVEHDEQTIRTADYIVDLGPGAGINGGNVIAEGDYKKIIQNEKSLTGQFLSGKLKIDVPQKRREGNGKYIEIQKAEEHNLKKINVKFPLGKFIAITGVSGSGKSTLMEDILFPAINNKINRSTRTVGKIKSISGIENIDKIINIDQSPIGRTPRSNPATYVGLFTPIRELFATLPDSKTRGYKPGRFSFNVKGGRCEQCKGDGTKKIENALFIRRICYL